MPLKTILRYAIVSAIAMFPPLGSRAETPRWTLELALNGTRVEGMPLIWSEQSVQLLARDGRLYSFAPSEAKNFRKSSGSFSSYSTAQMHDALRRELGPGFEITSTGHYLVAHPPGQSSRWSMRFEQLYNSFRHYFSVRGLNVNAAEFPLVAIVWPDLQQFMRYSRTDGTNVGPSVLGYYSQQSNRITLYDSEKGSAPTIWNDTAATLIHEVTHQVAFNTGVHRRFADSPKWLVEGLGTMFEAPGVWNSQQHIRQQDRINVGRFRDYKLVSAKAPKGFLAAMINSDRQFDVDGPAAYAQAWAFTFYLIETQPKKYADYLALTSRRPVFTQYPAAERTRDFTKVFGSNLAVLEAQFTRYMETVR